VAVSRRAFALGLGTWMALPTESLAGDLVIEGRVEARSTDDGKVVLTLLLTSSQDIGILTRLHSQRVDMLDGVLSWNGGRRRVRPAKVKRRPRPERRTRLGPTSGRQLYAGEESAVEECLVDLDIERLGDGAWFEGHADLRLEKGSYDVLLPRTSGSIVAPP